jgi:mono/diheme cytochrome c family protein
VQQQSDGALFYKITEGRGPMPSFKTTLTEQQRWDVVNHIRTLAPKAPKSS